MQQPPVYSLTEEIRITGHAKRRIAERHVAPYEVRKAINAASREFQPDGIYTVKSGHIVIQNHKVTTVLAPEMKPVAYGLPVRDLTK